jgi:tetratricopeptide (TPR) repeat protein
MSKFKQKFGRGGYTSDDNASDIISELSNDESASLTSNTSKSSRLKMKMSRFSKNKKKRKGGAEPSSDGTPSVGSSKNPRDAVATNGSTAATAAATSSARPQASTAGSVSSASTRRSKHANQSEEKRLQKDAKSRFNIGLVYLKTGDYAKAQDNLEHSLYCHVQLAGHNPKMYTNQSLYQIASVREKLGDCYLGNTAIVDKCLALDHYEEAKRLLESVHPEDRPDNVKEMLERVDEKLKLPELSHTGVRKPAPSPTKKYEMMGNEKAKKTLGVGVVAAAVGGAVAGGVAAANNAVSDGAAAVTSPSSAPQKKGLKGGFEKFGQNIEKFGKEVGTGITGVTLGIKDGFGELLGLDDDDSDEDAVALRSSISQMHSGQVEALKMAISHLERDNHRTALNHLLELKDCEAMENITFRALMADYMIKVADSAMESKKIGVAVESYEESLTVLKQDKDVNDEAISKATKGCIKGHKILANECEGLGDFRSAIEQRKRVCELLDNENKIVPACHQLIAIAYNHGKREEYDKSSVILSDASRKLFKGIQSLEYMPSDRLHLLVKSYQMRAICFTKMEKWRPALDQYDELLPLVAKESGKGSEDYLTVTIRKAALLVTLKNHASASELLREYFQMADINESAGNQVIVEPEDHILALDTSAAIDLKLGKVDNAISTFEKKLEFVENHLPHDDELKSDAMHKLGCLLAYKKKHEEALPLLQSALDKRKFLYDGRNKFLFETSWAVAATTQTLGDTDKALADYEILLEKIDIVEDSPINTVVVQNSAGKLFFEDGKIDEAVDSFTKALDGAESQNDPALKTDIMLNLANALSAKGDIDGAFDLYEELERAGKRKRGKMYFLTLYNKSLLLIKIGETEQATDTLHDIIETRSSKADDTRGNVYITLGNLSVEGGKIDSGLRYYENALDMFVDEHYDLPSITQTKKFMALAYMQLKKYDMSITILEDALTELSQPGMERKLYQLMKAEIWSCMSKVYQRRGDHASAKNFAKLGKFELLLRLHIILCLNSSFAYILPYCLLQLCRHTNLN